MRYTLWLGLVWEQEPHTSETGRVKLRAHPMDPQTEVVVEQMMEARWHKTAEGLVLQIYLDSVAEHKESLLRVPAPALDPQSQAVDHHQMMVVQIEHWHQTDGGTVPSMNS